MSLQVCSDTSEASELCERYRLYLKPVWKIKISVQLPALKAPGQAISSWEVMEKLRNMIKPDEFISLKVSKTNLVLIQFVGEVEKKAAYKRVLQKLQSNSMKLNGFTEVLKIRAAPAKLNYPTRHDWDSFFRDAKNIDEMKPGERPDTVYIQNLPTKWFTEDSSDKPSEYVLRKVFEAFGDIRQVAIPSAHCISSNETFGKVSNFNRDLVFDAYVQYKEYISFVKAMDSLKGMKMVCKSDVGKAYSADIKVDFDRTKYLSDKAIRRRAAELKIAAERTLSRQPQEQISVQPVVKEKREINEPKREKVSECKKERVGELKWDKVTEHKREKFTHHKEQSLKKATLSKAKSHREKEGKRLMKILLRKAEMTELDKKAKEKEEQIAHERLQQQKLLERALEEERRRKEEEEKQKQKYLQEQEKLLRQKLLKSLKAREQQRTEQLREKLRKEIAGRNMLKSVLVVTSKNDKSEKYNHAKKRLKL